jgi:hypothetical protein
MSAFIVDPEHINVLIWAGLQHIPGSAPLRWRFGNPTDLDELTRGHRHPRRAHALLEENTPSVNHLYNEHHAPTSLTRTATPGTRVGRSPNCSTRCTATSASPTVRRFSP